MNCAAWFPRAVIVVALIASPLALAQDSPPAKPDSASPPASPPAGSGTPRLQLSSTSMDFGEVWQGEPAIGDFTLKNVGTAPLTLSVKSSCGCTVATKPRSPLPPGESDTLRISYDTLKRKGKAHQQVTITTNDPDQPSVQIAVNGEVKPLYAATPTEGLIFDRLTSDSQVTQSLRIQSKYQGGPLRLKLREGQDFTPFAIELKEIQPGAEFELTATTKPPLNDEFARLTIALETGLERAPEIHIPVHANVQQDVSYRPRLLRAQRLLIVPKEETITVTYRADRPIKVAEVKPSAASIKVELPPAHPQRESTAWMQQPIRITLPPGDQLPTGEVWIDIRTDSREPRFAEFRIPVQIVETPDKTPRPAAPGAPDNNPQDVEP